MVFRKQKRLCNQHFSRKQQLTKLMPHHLGLNICHQALHGLAWRRKNEDYNSDESMLPANHSVFGILLPSRVWRSTNVGFVGGSSLCWPTWRDTCWSIPTFAPTSVTSATRVLCRNRPSKHTWSSTLTWSLSNARWAVGPRRDVDGRTQRVVLMPYGRQSPGNFLLCFISGVSKAQSRSLANLRPICCSVPLCTTCAHTSPSLVPEKSALFVPLWNQCAGKEAASRGSLRMEGPFGEWGC